MLDADLAVLYEVPTKALNQAVKRNERRFPPDFMFQLTAEEYKSLRFHFVKENGVKSTVDPCSKLIRVKSRLNPIYDSDLGSIPDYNTKRKPIIDDFYLPNNVTLVYASADSGKEYLANKLLAECDKKANTLIQEIQANPVNSSGLQKVHGCPYTHFRCWNY